ncbi:MAG: lipid II:glycine glycyltransferase FemX, partial [Candidatus Margulisiibacteriota bacterium]
MEEKIISYLDRQRWNEFVADSFNGSILQSYEWGEFKSHFGWQPTRLALEKDNKIVAGISILKRDIPLTGHCFFYAPRGPVIDFSDKDLLHQLLEVVEKTAERQHALSLKIDPEVLEDEEAVLANLKSLGFEKALKQVQPRATLVLNLERSLDEILMSFEEKTRYNIRLAEKKGVKVEEDVSERGMRL